MVPDCHNLSDVAGTMSAVVSACSGMFGQVVPGCLLSQAVMCPSCIHNLLVIIGLLLFVPEMAFLQGGYCRFVRRSVRADGCGVLRMGALRSEPVFVVVHAGPESCCQRAHIRLFTSGVRVYGCGGARVYLGQGGWCRPVPGRGVPYSRGVGVRGGVSPGCPGCRGSHPGCPGSKMGPVWPKWVQNGQNGSKMGPECVRGAQNRPGVEGSGESSPGSGRGPVPRAPDGRVVGSQRSLGPRWHGAGDPVSQCRAGSKACGPWTLAGRIVGSSLGPRSRAQGGSPLAG